MWWRHNVPLPDGVGTSYGAHRFHSMKRLEMGSGAQPDDTFTSPEFFHTTIDRKLVVGREKHLGSMA